MFIKWELKQKNQDEGKRGIHWACLPLPCYREKRCVWLCIICPRWTVGRNVGISGSRAVLSLTQTHLAFHSRFAIYDLCHLWQVLYPFQVSTFLFLKWESYYLTVVSRNGALMIFAPWRYTLLHDKRDFVVIIKVTNMLSSRLGDYPESSRLGLCTHVEP